MILFRATAIGETARQILEAGGRASVMGVTSRGVFITNGAERVIFVSFESWRGPLTINLARSTDFSQIEHGDPVTQESGHILFPQSDILIDAEDLPGWKAQIRTIDSIEPPFIERLRSVARHVVAEAEGKGWTVLLARWLNPDHSAELAGFLVPIEQSLIHLRQAIRDRNISEILPDIGQIIGRGSGLTPSGDDVIIGLLLMLSASVGKDSVLFNTQYAIRNTLSTTRLSTNLMSAASLGQADERLITALNGILTGDLPEAECAARLLAYGSSSGADTLLGMTLVV